MLISWTLGNRALSSEHKSLELTLPHLDAFSILSALLTAMVEYIVLPWATP